MRLPPARLRVLHVPPSDRVVQVQGRPRRRPVPGVPGRDAGGRHAVSHRSVNCHLSAVVAAVVAAAAAVIASAVVVAAAAVIAAAAAVAAAAVIAAAAVAAAAAVIAAAVVVAAAVIVNASAASAVIDATIFAAVVIAVVAAVSVVVAVVASMGAAVIVAVAAAAAVVISAVVVVVDDDVPPFPIRRLDPLLPPGPVRPHLVQLRRLLLRGQPRPEELRVRRGLQEPALLPGGRLRQRRQHLPVGVPAEAVLVQAAEGGRHHAVQPVQR